MSEPIIQGWCPGAHKPMMSGDGLVVRIRPWAAEISADQARVIADVASEFGNGFIDLTNRANLQIRGVAEDNLTPLLASLEIAGLLDSDANIERKRNIVVTPLWATGDLSHRLYQHLTEALPHFPDFPGKFGFVIDCGEKRVLQDVPGDIRFESSETGLIIRAAGACTGFAVDETNAMSAALELANWFMANRPADIRRMDRLLQAIELPAHFQGVAPSATCQPPQGPLYAPFGQLSANDLCKLADSGVPIRVTPWRAVIAHKKPDGTSLITDPNDPLMRVSACAGAPLCPQSSVETRDLARKLAGKWPGMLHVSGCTKGCAKPSASDVVFAGENGLFNLVRNGTAWDEPSLTQLSPEKLQNLDLT